MLIIKMALLMRGVFDGKFNNLIKVLLWPMWSIRFSLERHMCILLQEDIRKFPKSINPSLTIK